MQHNDANSARIVFAPYTDLDQSYVTRKNFTIIVSYENRKVNSPVCGKLLSLPNAAAGEHDPIFQLQIHPAAYI